MKKQDSTKKIKTKNHICNAFFLFIFTLPFVFSGVPYLTNSNAAGGSLEEKALYFTSARNISRFGWKNFGIADYGLNIKGSQEDHLFYTHFPSTPDIFLSFLLKLGLNNQQIRYVLVSLTLVGLFLLFRILKELNLEYRYIILIVCLFTFTYQQFWKYSDHIVFSWFTPTLFLGVLGTIKYLKNQMNGKRLIYFSLPLAYMTSFMGFFILMSVLMLLFFFKIIRDRRLISNAIGLSILCISLHIFRNILSFGFSIALKDLYFTLGNRTIGYPSRSKALEFFRENQIAWWGSDNSTISPLLEWFKEIALLRSGILILSSYILFRILNGTPTENRDFTEIKKKGNKFGLQSHNKIDQLTFCLLSFAAMSFAWYLIFPQQGKNYILPLIPNISTMFSVVAITHYLTISKREFKIKKMSKQEIRTEKDPFNAKFSYFIPLLLVTNILILVFNQTIDVKNALENSFYSSDVISFKNLPKLNGNVYTNLNAPLSFQYTGGNTYGYCKNSAFLNLDYKQCFSGRIFTKPDEKSRNYILISRIYLSSDIQCQPQPLCLDKLEEKLTKLYFKYKSGDRWVIYSDRSG